MARYRKIDIRMHGDEKFRRLTHPPPCGQALWWNLLAGKQTGIIPGIYSIGEMAFAEQLDWPLKGFREAFREVSEEGMAKADWKAQFVWVPNAIRYNKPVSANVIRSWRDEWDELPECELKAEAWQVLKDYLKGLSEGYLKAFLEVCPKPSLKPSLKPLANQEQEQEQEQEQDKNKNSPELCETSEPVEAPRHWDVPPLIKIPLVSIDKETNLPEEFPIFQSQIDEFAMLYPAVDIIQSLRNIRGWNISNPKQRKTRSGILKHINAWLTKEQNRGGNGTGSRASPIPPKSDAAKFKITQENAKRFLQKRGVHFNET